MDFNSFDSVSSSEKGAKMHIKHPATGALLYDNPDDPTEDNGKPCVVIVRGSEAPSVREAVREQQKARATDENASDDEMNMDELNDRICEIAARLIIGFENVSNGTKSATAPKDVEWFLNLNRINGRQGEASFAEQVNLFATSRANYLGNALSA